MATRTYRVVVYVGGRPEKIVGPRYTEKGDAEKELGLITASQQSGSDSIVTLPWLSVRERAIDAAFIEEGWSGGSVATSGPRRSVTGY